MIIRLSFCICYSVMSDNLFQQDWLKTNVYTRNEKYENKTVRPTVLDPWGGMGWKNKKIRKQKKRK